MSIASQLESVRSGIPQHVHLVAVSKTHPVSFVQEAYDAGQRDFGENKVQEMCAKAAELPQDIRWHLIGHLQTNKVKYIAPFVHLIHSIDSLKLLQEVDKRAAQHQRVIQCLLQVHIAEEETKFGFDRDEILTLFGEEAFQAMHNVCICGLMGMATFTDDQQQIAREFGQLSALFSDLRTSYAANERWRPEYLSMGMSGDYALAIDCGSNMVRVGSAIFGHRNYATPQA